MYVEFVPVTEDSTELAPGDAEREYLKEAIAKLRESYGEVVFLSFPGDEKSSGGCIAAGRGFFHINSHGGAEPCPFSPYSDINVRDTSLKEALDSELFTALRSGEMLMDDHAGGCVLYEPDGATVLDSLVSEYVAGRIYAAVRESFASEVAARRMAMDSAEKNAKQMISELQLSYNRARQSAITQEITEIVAGSGE